MPAKRAKSASADKKASIGRKIADVLALDKERRRAIVGSGALVLAWLLLVVSGYFLTYQIYFTEMPLERIAGKVTGDIKRKDFRYYQVVYFRGYALEPGQKIELEVGTPRVTRLGNPSVEFFVEIEPSTTDAQAGTPGRLKIVGLGPEPHIQALKPEKQQRFTVPWTNRLGKQNTVQIHYLNASDSAAGARSPPLVLATNIVGFSVWAYVIIFAMAGLALLMLAPAFAQQGFSWDWERNRWRLALVGIAALLFLLHSGGFTSNILFTDHSKIGAACKNLWTLLKTDHWRPTYYRDSGIGMVPFLAILVEGKFYRIADSFCQIFPTTRYLIYALWLAGLLFLVNTLRTVWGFRLALVFTIATALYFPFLRDLFKPDSDAYFIVLFAFYLGIVIRLLHDLGSFRVNAAFIVLLTFLMGFTKITPIILTLLLPLALLWKDWKKDHRQAVIRCAIGFAALFVTFQAGKLVSSQFHHPQRNVGIEGEPFQKHVFWHMIWAAYGLYDDNSAHDFVKKAKRRKRRVAKRTGLPPKTYLRQSETATQKVYKPDVLKALSERPGFFFSTALHRFHTHGLRFYRYNRLGPRLRALLLNADKVEMPKSRLTKDLVPTSRTISGETRSNVSPSVSLIRYGEAWKIAPLIFIGKLTQADMTRLADTLLLAAALIGMFGFKSVPLRFFLVMLAGAQMAFSFAFHDVDRYFMFCSWALLLGLSLFICNFVGAVNRRKI